MGSVKRESTLFSDLRFHTEERKSSVPRRYGGRREKNGKRNRKAAVPAMMRNQ